MHTSGADTTTIANAAKQQACAASSFAESASKINHGIGDAVDKLAQQAGDAETFFRTDERAWVEIGKIDTRVLPPNPPFRTIFKFGIYPKNYGKTVATDVRIHIDNVDTWGSFNDSKRGIRMFQDQLFHESGSAKRHRTPDKPGPQTIAPGELSIVPVYSAGQEPRRDGDNFTYTFILGRIDYIDAFRVQHWMRFCFMVTNASGELAHCQYGNDEDANPETPTKPTLP
jgi:hypothetical protein